MCVTLIEWIHQAKKEYGFLNLGIMFITSAFGYIKKYKFFMLMSDTTGSGNRFDHQSVLFIVIN